MPKPFDAFPSLRALVQWVGDDCPEWLPVRRFEGSNDGSLSRLVVGLDVTSTEEAEFVPHVGGRLGSNLGHVVRLALTTSIGKVELGLHGES